MLEKIKKIFFSKHFFIFACLFFLTLAIFSVNLTNDFLSDDWDFLYLAKNNDKNILSYFGTNYLGNHDGGSYRPLINVFWFSFFKLFSFNSFPFHFFNLFLHASNAFLVYLLVLNLKFFDNFKQKKVLAVLSAILFLVLPSKSEVIAWTATVNDSLMTFFTLVSILFFLLSEKIIFSQIKKILLYIFSLFFFILAILTKEMALCLPFLLFCYLIFDLLFFYSKIDFKQLRLCFFKFLPFFLLLISFFYIRYRATGLFLSGYNTKIDTSFNFVAIINSQISFFLGFFLTGLWRIKITLFFMQYKIFILLVFICSLILFYLKKKENFKIFSFLFFSYLLSTLAIYHFLLDLNINYFSEEGSRWLYLPSVFVSILLVYLFLLMTEKIKNNVKYFCYFGLFLFLIAISSQLFINNLKWQKASKISEKIISETKEILDNNNFDGVVFLGLIDNYHGAYIFRNNFKEALELKTGIKADMIAVKFKTLFDWENNWSIEKVSKNQMIFQEENKNKNIISDEKYDSLDYSLKLVDPVKNNYAVNYVYSSDKIYLKFSEEFLDTNKNKKILLLYINNDKVEIYQDFFDIYE